MKSNFKWSKFLLSFSLYSNILYHKGIALFPTFNENFNIKNLSSSVVWSNIMIILLLLLRFTYFLELLQ